MGGIRVYVGLGSNVDPETNIRQALSLLAQETRLTAISSMYRTGALGANGPEFINGVSRVETDLPARELKIGVLRKIESRLGRVRTADRFAPRTIDLDLLLYGGAVIREDGLVVPDPDIYARPFVALPLSELDPGLVVPGSNTPIAEIVRRLEPIYMQRLDGYTSRLRKEFLDEPRESREPGKGTPN